MGSVWDAFCVGDGVWVVKEICGKNKVCRVGGMEVQLWTHMSDMAWGYVQPR